MTSTSENQITKSILIALLVILCAFFAPGVQSLTAQTTETTEVDLSHAREILQMSKNDAKAEIAKLNAEEAAALASQILKVARDRNPDIDHLYYVVAQLNQIEATEKAQRRLNYLLWVILLLMTLFCAFVIYVIIDQRITLKKMRGLLDDLPDTSSKTNPEVYRGD
ncbi:MAG: hypothetical protein KDK30_05715 [Leptospiraceae bacterium]|nr:hypothetical protein [Leptospiraceae bacterium]MCB1314464.1 hypothetical protein [Leptospiraceae bacterium]MCB1322877.1 hypothetical protein [Leptospiraceae bacterium]